MFQIKRLQAREILDSRGRPTVWARCELRSGAVAAVSVPSGASTGAAEAWELRDGDPQRYRGLGCRQAVAHIEGEIQRTLTGCTIEGQQELDSILVALDGTLNKARLGANALLAVSLAFARVCAVEEGIPLYQHFANLLGQPLRTLPRLTINLFSGGKHAGGQAPIQDVLIVPAAATTIDEGMATTYAVYQSAAALIKRKYGARALTADEGGLAPDFVDAESMLGDAVQAIQEAGFAPGSQVALAVDVASSHFFVDGHYQLDTTLTTQQMIETLAAWVERYPIVSVEDGLAEDAWADWPQLRQQLGQRALVLGDDFLCTNPQRIRRAIETNAANALLLKVNQIGSLSEAMQSLQLARNAGWKVTISARSGETEDDWLADLAVGWAGDQIKVGSITHSERLAKYNRLLQIESETGLSVVKWPLS
ncbi:MAG: enolase [Caldilineaceae bacterium]